MTLRTMGTAAVFVLAVVTLGAVAQDIKTQQIKKRGDTSFMPVDQNRASFPSVMKRMKADKPKI
jgi:hypothetical protein